MSGSTKEARDRARAQVNDEMVRQGLNPRDLARRAGVDFDTVADFLNGKRWPQSSRRNMISTALGWVPEAIDMLVRGEDPRPDAETVRPGDQDGGVLLSMPPEALEGLGPAEREEVIAAAKLSALRAAREIRRRLDEEPDR